MIRRRLLDKKKTLYIKRFFPAGSYSFTIPKGCKSVDLIAIGGGGGGGGRSRSGGGGGGGGYFSQVNDLLVTSGDVLTISVGVGGAGGYEEASGSNGSPSSVKLKEAVLVSVNGGEGGVYPATGGDGSSKGGDAGRTGIGYSGGQSGNAKDFYGKDNAGGGGGGGNIMGAPGGGSDYVEGSGSDGYGLGGSGYGGGGGGSSTRSNTPGDGGDGTVLIRYYAY